jgi:gluconolactonase
MLCSANHKTNTMKSKSVLFLIPVIAFVMAFIQDETLDDLIQPGAKLEKLADGFLFTEGPSADSKGNVYFTDQPNDRIMIWSTSGQLSTFMQPSGRSNGLSFDTKGNLWSCADEKNELWEIAPDKSVTRIPSKYQDKALNGPNDVWIADNGFVYFTDPFYKRTWWDHTSQPQEIQGVYLLSPDHKKIVRVIDDLVQPNGIVGTPDGKTLFVADIGGNKTWSYTINPDGQLTNKTLFCEMGSDGMTIDTNGNIYLTGKGVTVFNRAGKRIGNIEVPESWTANVCFGDHDMKSLFITASKGLYRLRMKIMGTAG